MAEPFLDTNVILRHLRNDHPEMSPRATALLGRVERGELRVRISDLVIFEAVFTLQRSYGVPRHMIAEALLPLIELTGVVLPGKRVYRDVFGLYAAGPIGFADSYHVVLMRRMATNQVISFDSEFDRVPGIERLAP
jgi:predicted nucleic acid-binding protein